MQMLREDQLTGQTLGTYTIEQLLGHGQLSAVYLARHTSRGQRVIVTVFNYPNDRTVRGHYAALFAREGAALLQLQHPHILPTLDYGEQDGLPYLVTAYVKGASLAQALKQQQRFTLQQTLDVFQQVASGLDEAHSKGVTHGILSLSNVLMNNDLAVQVAGFGLKTVLEIQANTQSRQPYAHLFNASGTFLGNPAYISPERVMGQQIDARSDLYALGVMLFEMLSGKLPFSGANSLETALMRVQQPVPSLHNNAPDIPQALDLLINKALERDPARRYQRASEISTAFERVTKTLNSSNATGTVSRSQTAHNPQITLPPTINWFDEDADHMSTGKWQLMPPIITGQLPAVSPSQPTEYNTAASNLPRTGALSDSPNPATAARMPAIEPTSPRTDALPGIDPFAWWANNTTQSRSLPPAPGTFAQRPPVRLSSSRSGRRQPTVQDRRRAVKLLATGGAVVGVLGVGGITFAHFSHSLKQSQALLNTVTRTTTGVTQTTPGSKPTTAPTHATQTPPTPKPSPTKAAQPTPTAKPTQQPTPKPTQPPQPTPTQPSHTGTVIGHTNMSNNSSITFSNPADGQDSLLIRLANGNFVACERSCTHEGVPVNYDTGQKQIVCPAHGAVFDPANGFNHLSGPGNGPLATVKITVNADGTITTG